MNSDDDIFSISVGDPCKIKPAASYNEVRKDQKTYGTNISFKTLTPLFRRNTVSVLSTSVGRYDTSSSVQHYSQPNSENYNFTTKLFWRIISGKEEDQISYYCGLYGILCLMVVLTLLAIQLLVPKHNVITFPEYWYELPISFIIENFFGKSLLVVFSSSILFNTSYTLSWKAFWYIFVCISLSYMCPYVLINVIWIYGGKYSPPVPFVGYICGVFGYLGSCVSLYTVFPLSWHKDEKTKKRLKALLTLVMLFGLTSVEYLIISFILSAIPRTYQWILAIFFPLTKHATEKVVLNVAYVASGRKDDSTKFVASCIVVTGYKIFLVLSVKSSSSDATNYTILISEFLINMYLCLKIILLHHKGKESKLGKEILNKLVLKETIEFMVPLTYIGTFLMAYYGPNGSLIGSIRNSFWHYKEVTDVEKLIWHTSLFCIIDGLSAIIASILLWTVCKIDFYLEYCKMINKFWWITALILVAHLHTVSTIKISQIK
jgi:hypothetical protein